MIMEAIESTQSQTQTLGLGAGLVILMGVNIVMGTVNSLFESEFQVSRFFKGLGKAVVLILCFCAVYVAGVLNEDTLSFDLGTGNQVNIVDAMHALLLAGYYTYSKQVFVKMGEIVGINGKLPDIMKLIGKAGAEVDQDTLDIGGEADIPNGGLVCPDDSVTYTGDGHTEYAEEEEGVYE